LPRGGEERFLVVTDTHPERRCKGGGRFGDALGSCGGRLATGGSGGFFGLDLGHQVSGDFVQR
jgi:hypothetical protein